MSKDPTDWYTLARVTAEMMLRSSLDIIRREREKSVRPNEVIFYGVKATGGDSVIDLDPSDYTITDVPKELPENCDAQTERSDKKS